MSRQTTPPLPIAWVDRLFDRFKAIYGSQRIGAMFAEVDADEVRRAWARTLGRFAPEVLRDAVDNLAVDGGAWPPTLPEFVARCEQIESRPGHRLALPVPARSADELAAGREQMDRVRQLLRAAVKRPHMHRGEPVEREPGCDDEPIMLPACTCVVGTQRADTMCRSCAEFAAARQRRIAA